MSASEAIAARFPKNPYVARLLERARSMDVRLAASPVPEQWLYHPVRRTLYVWLPDLNSQSLSYLTTILAHELGHARDFDERPELIPLVSSLHWSQVPLEIECSAFVQGFLLLQELAIPIRLEQYAQMIEEPLADRVAEVLRERLCSLDPVPSAVAPAAAAPPAVLPSAAVPAASAARQRKAG